MTKILIALLAIYAVWSSYRIVLLSAMIHSIARILEDLLVREEQVGPESFPSTILIPFAHRKDNLSFLEKDA